MKINPVHRVLWEIFLKWCKLLIYLFLSCTDSKNVPVSPLLNTADEVLGDFLDIVQVWVETAVQEGQAWLEKRTGDLVQSALGGGWVTAAQLWLRQDEVHQAYELLRRQLQHKLLSALLQRHTKPHLLHLQPIYTYKNIQFVTKHWSFRLLDHYK